MFEANLGENPFFLTLTTTTTTTRWRCDTSKSSKMWFMIVKIVFLDDEQFIQKTNMYESMKASQVVGLKGM